MFPWTISPLAVILPCPTQPSEVTFMDMSYVRPTHCALLTRGNGTRWHISFPWCWSFSELCKAIRSEAKPREVLRMYGKHVYVPYLRGSKLVFKHWLLIRKWAFPANSQVLLDILFLRKPPPSPTLLPLANVPQTFSLQFHRHGSIMPLHPWP